MKTFVAAVAAVVLAAGCAAAQARYSSTVILCCGSAVIRSNLASRPWKQHPSPAALRDRNRSPSPGAGDQYS